MATKNVHNGATGNGTSFTAGTNAGAADDDTQRVILATDDPAVARLGATNETAPASDTAAAAANGRLQRIAQRLSSLIALIPAALGQAAKAASLSVTIASDDDVQGKLGALTEAAPASDTASSGLNGRLQRIAQRVTTLIGTVRPVLWQAAPVSRSTGLTTELNSLANAAYSVVGTAFDNTANLDQFGACDIVLASLDPAAGGYLQLFLVQSLDGTNYEDAPTTTTNPGTHMLVATVALLDTSSAKRVMTPWFRLPPGKFKLVLYNGSGVSLGATGNTVTLYTSNDEVQ